MTLLDIVYKAGLFFLVFYGAILLTSLISKKIREKNDDKEDSDQAFFVHALQP